MWFWTDGGDVCKYDGINWTDYTFDWSYVFIIKNIINNLWFWSNGYWAKKYDFSTWTTYDTATTDIVNNVIYDIYEDSYWHKWFGTAWGVSVYTWL